MRKALRGLLRGWTATIAGTWGYTQAMRVNKQELRRDISIGGKSKHAVHSQVGEYVGEVGAGTQETMSQSVQAEIRRGTHSISGKQVKWVMSVSTSAM